MDGTNLEPIDDHVLVPGRRATHLRRDDDDDDDDPRVHWYWYDRCANRECGYPLQVSRETKVEKRANITAVAGLDAAQGRSITHGQQDRR